MMYHSTQPVQPASKAPLVGSSTLYQFPGRMVVLQALRAAVRRTV